MGDLTHIGEVTYGAVLEGLCRRLEEAGLDAESLESEVDAVMLQWPRLDAYFGIAIDDTARQMDTDKNVLYFLAAHAYLVEVYFNG